MGCLISPLKLLKRNHNYLHQSHESLKYYMTTMMRTLRDIKVSTRLYRGSVVDTTGQECDVLLLNTSANVWTVKIYKATNLKPGVTDPSTPPDIWNNFCRSRWALTRGKNWRTVAFHRGKLHQQLDCTLRVNRCKSRDMCQMSNEIILRYGVPYSCMPPKKQPYRKTA